jgi:CRISPR-associated protein Cmr2
MAYLFSLALGPAQAFIAAARRTRDLWFSSWLLSELSKAAAREIGKDRLIFPSVADDRELEPGSEFNVANKILAKVDGDPRRLGESVKAAVRKRLDEIRDEAFRRLPTGSCNLDKAEAQIDDLPEIYWAAVPLDGDYAQAREQVERLLAARKRTRDFGPTDKWRGNEWKSALDGLRESVIRKRSRELLSLGIKEKEELCGVGLLKRLGEPGNQKEGEGFASVPHIAAWPLIQSFSDRHKKALDEYVSFLQEKGVAKSALYRPPSSRGEIFPYDGHILFEEQLKGYFDETEQKTELEQAREKLRDLLRKEIGAAPLPYYAILRADGDRMGEAIDAQDTEDRHKNLSRALSQFAGEAREIVSGHRGSMIYAGGDDVLALVPLSAVIQCARRLADTFKDKLKDFKNAKGKSPTFSVGVGVSHQMEPLEDALNLAHAAEEEAKRYDGKDALCVKVSKRSGSVTTVVDHWDALDKRLNLFTSFHQGDEVPDGAAYELRRLADDFKDFPREYKAEAYKKEAARILSRKRSKRSTEEIKKDVQQNLLARISDDPEEASRAFSALADELIVARLFVNKFERKGETK